MEMDYTYGVARIRALESSLFGNDTIQALLNLETYDQWIDLLSQVFPEENKSKEVSESTLPRKAAIAYHAPVP